MLTSPTPRPAPGPPGKSKRKVRPGDVNPQRQKVIERRSNSVNGMRGQSIYELECQVAGCGHRYCELGILFERRCCPKCGGGKPGLPVPAQEQTLFDSL